MVALCPSPRSMKFFQWGYVQHHIFVPPLPTKLHDLKHQTMMPLH